MDKLKLITNTCKVLTELSRNDEYCIEFCYEDVVEDLADALSKLLYNGMYKLPSCVYVLKDPDAFLDYIHRGWSVSCSAALTYWDNKLYGIEEFIEVNEDEDVTLSNIEVVGCGLTVGANMYEMNYSWTDCMKIYKWVAIALHVLGLLDPCSYLEAVAVDPGENDPDWEPADLMLCAESFNEHEFSILKYVQKNYKEYSVLYVESKALCLFKILANKYNRTVADKIVGGMSVRDAYIILSSTVKKQIIIKYPECFRDSLF